MVSWCLVTRSGWDCDLLGQEQPRPSPSRVCECAHTCGGGVGVPGQLSGPAGQVGLPVGAHTPPAPGVHHLISLGERGVGAGPGVPRSPTHALAVQVWSITYHSWLTFVLLLWACLIWTVRSRHQMAMLCSPFILLYGLALCSLRYVWAMDLRPELPTALGPVSLRQLGLEHTRYPCLDLGAMVSLFPPPACL